ncbi:MAG: lantibiotic immunity ABC transporter MutG family permease subunit [Clostridium sp.]
MLFKYLKMDFYKMIHSKNFMFHILVPIITIGVFIIYFRVYSSNKLLSMNINKLSICAEVIGMGLPIIIAMVMQFMCEQEEGSKFQNFLTSPGNKCIPYISKLVVVFLFGIVAIIITFLGLSIFFSNGVPLELYFKLIIIMILSSIILYIVQFLVVLFWGKGVNIGVGIIGVLIYGLMQNGLGDNIWTYIPWAYAGRISNYIILGANREIFSEKLWLTIITYIFVLILFGVIFIEKWEGRKWDD